MTDTAEARAETLRRWFLEAGTWTGDDHLWRNRFVEAYKEHVALSARLAQVREDLVTEGIRVLERAERAEQALAEIEEKPYRAEEVIARFRDSDD